MPGSIHVSNINSTDMANTTMFPARPFNGMRFTDQWKRIWVYSSSSSSWQFNGLSPTIQEADSENPGLLSPEMKVLINGIKEKSGSFGVIAKNQFGRGPRKDYSNVMSGNIKLVSNSLDISCNDQIPIPELGQYPSLDFNFSEDFLDTLCVEVPGERGKKGRRGFKGETGVDGTGDGPVGEQGDPGQDALGFSTVEDVEVVFDDGFYSSAVTDVILDPERAILAVTRSEALVPTEDTPATEVVAVGAPRDVEFTDPDSFDYRIVRPEGTVDPIELPMDVFVLAYPVDFDPDQNRRFKVAATGCCCEEADSSALALVQLSDYVDQTIEKYQNALRTINDEYDREVKEFIFKKDEEARKALDVLVQKLSDEQFRDAFEYCMSLNDNGVCGQQCCGELAKMRQDPYNNPGYVMAANQGTQTGQMAAISNNIAALVEAVESIAGDGDGESQSQSMVLNPTLGEADPMMFSGISQVAAEISSSIADDYGIPNLSTNIVAQSRVPNFTPIVGGNAALDCGQNECPQEVPRGWQFNQFSTSVCSFAEQILLASDESNATEAGDYCPGSEGKTLTTINISPGEIVPFGGSGAGASLIPGAYIIQYKGGSIFDSNEPICGYVVGTGRDNLGLVMRVFRANEVDTNGDPVELVIPWPASSVVKNPLYPEEVEEGYLLGPITESAIGVVIEQGDRIVIESVATGDRSSGTIELTFNHCSRCIE